MDLMPDRKAILRSRVSSGVPAIGIVGLDRTLRHLEIVDSSSCDEVVLKTGDI